MCSYIQLMHKEKEVNILQVIYGISFRKFIFTSFKFSYFMLDYQLFYKLKLLGFAFIILLDYINR